MLLWGKKSHQDHRLFAFLYNFAILHLASIKVLSLPDAHVTAVNANMSSMLDKKYTLSLTIHPKCKQFLNLEFKFFDPSLFEMVEIPYKIYYSLANKKKYLGLTK